MNSKIAYQDRYGSFELCKTDLVAEVKVIGSCGTRLIENLTEGLMNLSKEFSPYSWGYLSLSPNVDAASQSAEIAMIEMTKKMIANGCVVDAYILTTPLAIAQTARIRTESGVTSDIQNVLFSNADDARTFIHGYINKFNRKE